ncbi:MAG: hypothetical protein RL595_1721 [Planctomycetota bacterium]
MAVIGVIGAGISGLTAATMLVKHGLDVRIFEKSWRAGGRTCSRRIRPDFIFDHGAQYFTVSDPAFAFQVEQWAQNGIIAEWKGRVVKFENGKIRSTSPKGRFVGVPKMESMAEELSKELNISYETKIVHAAKNGKSWTITDEIGETFGPFDFLICTLPAPQARDLFQAEEHKVLEVPMVPCWSVFVAFQSKLEVSFDGAFVNGKILSWVARNSSKPGRDSKFDGWVLHGTPEWSSANFEIDAEIVEKEFLQSFEQLTGRGLPEIVCKGSHRWKYSMANSDGQDAQFHIKNQNLVFGGDWLNGGKVEGAFLSGRQAAFAVLDAFGLPLASC